MAGRYGVTDYGCMTKGGALLGGGLFAVGALAEYGLHATGGATETLDTVFLTMEFLGPLIVLASVIVFGIVLPLTE